MENKGTNPYKLLIRRLERDNGILLLELNSCLEKMENQTKELNIITEKYNKLKTENKLLK